MKIGKHTINLTYSDKKKKNLTILLHLYQTHLHDVSGTIISGVVCIYIKTKHLSIHSLLV